MSTTTADTKQACTSIFSTLAGLGTTWAAYGLKLGQIALEQSAGALGKTASTLETLAAELDKKPAARVDAVVDADAPAPAATA